MRAYDTPNYSFLSTVQALERSPAPMRPPLRTHGPAYPANLASEVPRTDGNFGNREIERRVGVTTAAQAATSLFRTA